MEYETRRITGECPYDQGGYFVVDGQEKVIVSHERKVENKLYFALSFMHKVMIKQNTI